MKTCEVCNKTIDKYWGYLSDFYPDFFPSRDTSKDQVLWGVQVIKGTRQSYHYFCSEEHAQVWMDKHNNYKVVGEVADNA